MAHFEVWEEGYACTGESGDSYLAWEGEAKDFEDACQKLIEHRRNRPERWGSVAAYHKFEKGKHSWWGCGWYPDRARASFFDRRYFP